MSSSCPLLRQEEVIQVLPLIQDQLKRRRVTSADETYGDVARPLPAGVVVIHDQDDDLPGEVPDPDVLPMGPARKPDPDFTRLDGRQRVHFAFAYQDPSGGAGPAGGRPRLTSSPMASWYLILAIPGLYCFYQSDDSIKCQADAYNRKNPNGD